MTILHNRIADTPLAVIDLETTGLSPTGDRIVEIAIVRVDPGAEPRLVLDTLVNPQRRVTCSEIHGVYDEDVVGAPLLHELAQPIADAIDGAMLASFNVYFDMKFVDAGLKDVLPIPLPHLCLMWLRPALGLGDRASLGATCGAMGVPIAHAHRAANDAMASATLWSHYLRATDDLNLVTFHDLARRKKYKFVQSWDREHLRRDSLKLPLSRAALKPRRDRSEQERKAVRRDELNGAKQPTPAADLSTYWDAMLSAIVDGELSAHEIDNLRELQRSCNLSKDSLRFVHGRVISGLLDAMTSDVRIDDAEAAWLANVMHVLRDLGWAPGDAITTERGVGHQERALASTITATSKETSGTSWWSRLFG